MNRWKVLLVAVVPLICIVAAFMIWKQSLANMFAANGNLRVLSLVVKLGVDVNREDGGTYPLIQAIKGRQVPTIAYLLSEKADVNVRDGDYATPLLWALRENQPAIAKQLIAARADVNVGDKAGWTPLRQALQTANNDTIDMLIRAGADVNLADNVGETPLMRAAQLGNVDIMRLLLKNGANPSDRDKGGHTAIEYAHDPRDPAFITSLRRVYFVPIGDAPMDEIDALADHYREKFGMEIKVLPAMKLDDTDLDVARGQLVAENLVKSMARNYPDYANNWSAVMIGITGEDMYPQEEQWQFCFGWRSSDGRSGVVSTARLGLHFPDEVPEEASLTQRLRKAVTKDIGLLYFWKPSSHNPKSVLYDGMNGVQDLDLVTENF